MIRKMIAATMMLALAALFYVTDRIEQQTAPVGKMTSKTLSSERPAQAPFEGK